MTTKELREKRAGLIYEMQDILKQADEGKLTKEQEERFDKLEADEADLMKQIERAERMEARDKEIAATKADEPIEEKAEEREVKRVEAFKRYLETGDAKELRADQDGQSTETDADGGYTVPQTWAAAIEKALLEYANPRDWATVIKTNGGGQLNYPTVNDTGNKSTIISEEEISTESKKTIGTKAINAYTLRTPIIPISLELLQDSAYDFEGLIAGLLAENDARGLNYYCTVGTGSSQHNGIVTASTLGVTATADDAFTRNEIVDLVHSVDPAYRKGGKFMFNDVVLKAIKKLTVGSSDARPLWQPGIAFGDPNTVEGYEYIVNQDMASSIAASAKTILFGDFKKYLVREVRGYGLVRFNEYYMRSLQIGLMGFSRSDGELLNAGTNPVKHLIQASS